MDILSLHNADFRVELSPFGATLHRLIMLHGPGNILVSRPDPFQTVKGYLGASVGRYANRIDAGAFELDGVRHQLDANEPPNTLHGGAGGFSERVWEVRAHTDTAAVMALTSDDGDQGFPGRLEVEAEFSLLDDGLQVVYRAQTDAPTVVNLTCHPYFNLRGGRGTVSEYVLRMPAGHYTPLRPDGIPTGVVADVTGTAMDFRSPRMIGTARSEAIAQGIAQSGGYDHNFVIDGMGLRQHLEMLCPDGPRLRVFSDAPAVQLYDGAHFDGTLIGAADLPVPERGGIAIEPQNYPDAPNHANFPSSVLRPGQSYSRTIQYRLS
ncbi:MAG: galactose mutarotase [Propionibacteriaceae bacterium]|nr:galactose mutarotase [Propionibacteriaceae bacterium]